MRLKVLVDYNAKEYADIIKFKFSSWNLSLIDDIVDRSLSRIDYNPLEILLYVCYLL